MDPSAAVLIRRPAPRRMRTLKFRATNEDGDPRTKLVHLDQWIALRYRLILPILKELSAWESPNRVLWKRVSHYLCIISWLMGERCRLLNAEGFRTSQIRSGSTRSAGGQIYSNLGVWYNIKIVLFRDNIWVLLNRTCDQSPKRHSVNIQDNCMPFFLGQNNRVMTFCFELKSCYLAFRHSSRFLVDALAIPPERLSDTFAHRVPFAPLFGDPGKS
jgi:hypothetical protein